MNIYEIRKAGRDYCQTEGSEHYKSGTEVEPIDLIISLGSGEGFCIASIIKYASRFGKTQNLKDLRKISDYAHILAGIKLGEIKEEPVPIDEKIQSAPTGKRIPCMGGECRSTGVRDADEAKYCLSQVLQTGTSNCGNRLNKDGKRG